jgi:pilus assembly protein Flp/PilA
MGIGCWIVSPPPGGVSHHEDVADLLVFGSRTNMCPGSDAGALLGKLRLGRLSLMIKKLIDDRRGSQMVEYILLVGVVALLAIAAFRKFGWTVREKTDQQTEAVMQDDKDD